MPEYITPNTETDPERALRLVTDAVRRGESPSVAFNDDELAEFFTPEQVDEFDAQAVKVIQERAARLESRDQARSLQRTTELVLREMEAEEKAARRAKAEAIARERLGL